MRDGPAEVLLVLSGAPGVGKTTLAREVARRTGAVHVRVDTFEQALLREGLVHPPIGPQGYALAHAVAADGLRSGRHVIADAVDDVPEAEEGWRTLAAEVGVPHRAVRLVCSDVAEHRRRVQARTADLPGHEQPTWEVVRGRGVAPAPAGARVVDTATAPLHQLAAALAAEVEALPEQVVAPAHLLLSTHRFGAGEVVLRTERLVLRRWRESDLEPFAAMNADPAVMEHLSGVLDRVASDRLARYCDACFDAYGHGLAAVEVAADGAFVGFVGLAPHRSDPRHVEVGWRLARSAWGRGYATEAARAWVAAAPSYGLDRLVSLTVPQNTASLAVMRRLGMQPAGERRWQELRLVVHALDLSR